MPRKPAAGKKTAQETRSTRSQRKRESPGGAEVVDTVAEQPTPSKRRRISGINEPEPELELESEQEGRGYEEGEGEGEGEGEVEVEGEAIEKGGGDADKDKLADAGTAPVSTPRRRGRPAKGSATPAKVRGAVSAGPTPTGPRSAAAKGKLETPSKPDGPNGTQTPGRRGIADRSARRKSARALIDRVVGGGTSDDEAGDEDLAREIYESSGEEEGEEQQQQEAEAEEDLAEDEGAAATPSKTPRGGKKQARARRKRSPTPPRDLPPHEQYFFQNKPGAPKTSANTLASLDLLTHDEYFTVLRGLVDPHESDVRFLADLHAQSFNQWTFELAQGFSLCLYGYGSKRALLHRFAQHLHRTTRDPGHKIVVINGYLRTLTTREILATIASALAPTAAATTSAPQLPDILDLLSSPSPTPPLLTLILHSADAPPLRKPAAQTLLSTLAAHPRVRLACGVDTPSFAALWDSGRRAALNLAFHDATTFAPRAPAELDVVDEVHELLGRRARRVGGRDGVAFVLKSLPENARSLFRLLVGEVLVAMAEEGEEDDGGEEGPGVEYRMLYNRAVEEFICSSEMAFRTLLKEFHDHQMITSRKDVLGTELLSLPFRKEELEAILEDLVS